MTKENIQIIPPFPWEKDWIQKEEDFLDRPRSSTPLKDGKEKKMPLNQLYHQQNLSRLHGQYYGGVFYWYGKPQPHSRK